MPVGRLFAAFADAKARKRWLPKSMVAVAHTKLPDRARADKLKRFRGERLDALAEQLAGAPRR